MKLLFDQNLSFRLIEIIATAFPDSKHVKDFDLVCAPDADVWSFAQDNGFTVVSKDADFVNLALLRGQPPKLIYIRVGNCTTERIGQLLLSSHEAIHEFLNDPIESVLTLR
jgi:predicted nuclease of predicted toxin-antitoxin system